MPIIQPRDRTTILDYNVYCHYETRRAYLLSPDAIKDNSTWVSKRRAVYEADKDQPLGLPEGVTWGWLTIAWWVADLHNLLDVTPPDQLSLPHD